MREIYQHRYTCLAHGVDQTSEDAVMYDGQLTARNMAVEKGCDIRHDVYNSYLRQWDHLGVYHPDGTCTDWTGERKLFVEDPAHPWAKIEEGGER